MPTDLALLGKYNLKGPAGMTVVKRFVWLDGNDDPLNISEGVTVWVGGSDRALSNFDGATAYEATAINGNESTHAIPVPAGSTALLLRLAVGDVAKTVGKLYPSSQGGDDDLEVVTVRSEGGAVTVYTLGTLGSPSEIDGNDDDTTIDGGP